MGSSNSSLRMLCMESTTFEQFVKKAYCTNKKTCPYCGNQYPDEVTPSGMYRVINKAHYSVCPTIKRMWREVHGNKKVCKPADDVVARLTEENARLRAQLKEWEDRNATDIEPNAPPVEGETEN